ncbi:hypothetical protein PLESTB_001781600 [Pleodorina starrii]|uniref:Uncharacterized protein n=1 Tax=Pleodorina starrii TaxID=330485 RepID=A0A9W6F9T6_9CHLO|nr:hypothetical protein PLESTB_001781600 [Pleodorina starrii]
MGEGVAAFAQSEGTGTAPPVSFVTVSPAPEGGPALVALAKGCTLQVTSWELSTDVVQPARRRGELSSAEPHRWLGASWHPERSGLLAAICQAEVRLVLCHPCPGPGPHDMNPNDGGSGADACGHGPPAGGSATSDYVRPHLASQAPTSTPGTQPISPTDPPTAAATGPPAAAAASEAAATTTSAAAAAAAAPIAAAEADLDPGWMLLQLSRLPPPGAVGHGTAAGQLCRSVQCHVAWVGEARGAVLHEAAGPSFGAASAESDALTLVVGWGPELELISWSAAALRSAVAAAMAGAAGGDGCIIDYGGGGGGARLPPLAPASRRTLLLGVPGPLCAVSLGPYGSVLATTEAGLALSYQSPAPTAAPAVECPAGSGSGGGEGAPAGAGRGDGDDEGRSGVSGSLEHQQQECQRAEGEHQQQQGQQQHGAQVIDLRGGLTASGSGLTQRGGGGGGGQDVASTPSLASLFNISLGLSLDAGAGADADDKLGASGLAARAGSKGEAAATAARQLLLGAAEAAPSLAGATAASAASALCVVWPGRIALLAAGSDSQAGPAASPHVLGGPAPGAGTAAASHPPAGGGGGDDGGGGGEFRSLAPLHLPRPDLLSCCGELVLVASSLGPPAVSAFRLTARGGLTQLARLTPAWPHEVVAAGRGRLRGLAAVLAPSLSRAAGGGAAAAGAAGGREGRGHPAGVQVAQTGEATEALMVLMVGEVESPPAGGGIFGFGRAVRPVNQKVARLVASAHPLSPPLTAAAAAAETAAAAPAVGGAAAVAPDAVVIPTATATATAITAPAAAEASASSPATAGSAPVAGSEGAEAAAPEAAPAAAADAIVAAVVGQLAELLAGFRRHVDSRMDRLEGSLQAMAARLDALEAAVRPRQ